MLRTEFPELLEDDFTVDVYYKDGSFAYKGKVVGCDFDIGITVVDTYDNNNFVFCLIGETVLEFDDKMTQAIYKVLFYLIVSQLKKGYFNDGIFVKVVGGLFKRNVTIGSASIDTCAFNK